jgi:hypothetical protein
MSSDFRKNIQISNLMKIRPTGNELFHGDGRTDGRTDGWTHRHDEANSRIPQLCERALQKGKTEEVRRGMKKENKKETNDTQERKVNLEKVEIRKRGAVCLLCSETGFFDLLKVRTPSEQYTCTAVACAKE